MRTFEKSAHGDGSARERPLRERAQDSTTRVLWRGRKGKASNIANSDYAKVANSGGSYDSNWDRTKLKKIAKKLDPSAKLKTQSHSCSGGRPKVDVQIGGAEEKVVGNIDISAVINPCCSDALRPL